MSTIDSTASAIALATRQAGRLVIRETPARVEWRLNDLLSADRQIDCRFVCSLRARNNRGDQQLLEEVLLGDQAMLTVARVAEHFEPALRRAAEQVICKKSTGAWLAESAEELIAPMQKAAEAVAFGCGLDVLPPMQVQLDSPGYRRERAEALRRDAEAKRQSEDLDRIRRTNTLLREFHSLKDAAPEVPAGELLQRIGSSDRTETFQSLLEAGAREVRAAPLWVVAGDALVKIELHDGHAETKVTRLPEALGPLRSVRASAGGLLVGAQRGVWEIDIAGSREPRSFVAPVRSSLGFNQAIVWNGEVWATHGEAGIAVWTMDNPEAPRLMLPAAPFTPGGPRFLTPLDDDRAILAAGSQLFLIDRQGRLSRATGADGTVRAIVRGSQSVLVVRDHRAEVLDGDTLAVNSQIPFVTSVQSVGTLPWMNEERLLLGYESGSIECLGICDSANLRYASGYRNIRMVTGSAGLVAAAIEDRSRVLLWRSWEPARPTAEINIANLVRHRVTDLNFSSANEANPQGV